MMGSGTCRDVCDELDVRCTSKDIRFGFDACDPTHFDPSWQFDFVWIHPPYWRQKVYSDDARDMSTAPNLSYFLFRYQKLIENCASVLAPGGKLAILMADYSDRVHGFVPLTYHTKRLAFARSFRQVCTDIIRFSHGASSSYKTYRSSFIPGLHDTCMVFEKLN
jgi:SAM-dependent methyltransferase